jgi:hypothetical protein
MQKKINEILTKMGMLFVCAILISACTAKVSSAKAQEIIQNDSVSFTYSDVLGIGKDAQDNRRDPSDIIKVGGKYYIYYTKMISPQTSGYWGTIWYATSEDEGYTWQEQGMAIGLGEEGTFDSHSVFTPNILSYKEKYYLYYTAVQPTPGNANGEFEGNSTNDFTAIGLAVAESPDGPFTKVENNPVLTISKDSADFDSYRIDDAALLVKDSKIWLYYKGRSIIYGKTGPRHTKMGVAFAENPEGPFMKHHEPIIDKGHEVLIWSQNGGIASLASLSKSIHFAKDGLHFTAFQENLSNIPMAPGLYRPELEEGNVIQKFPGWGISMVQKKGVAYLVRFEMR